MDFLGGCVFCRFGWCVKSCCCVVGSCFVFDCFGCFVCDVLGWVVEGVWIGFIGIWGLVLGLE